LNQKVPATQLNTVMVSLFDRTNGIGVSFVRNPMGASDWLWIRTVARILEAAIAAGE